MGPAWKPIVDDLIKGIESLGIRIMSIDEEPPDEEKALYVCQVKEKFGGLRFYYTVYNISREEYDKIEDLLAKAEDKAMHTCDTCGEYIEAPIYKGWIFPKCKTCFDK